MYDWLGNAVDDESHVVTPNGRLAAALTDAFASQQIEAGLSVWRTPAISAWEDWLNARLNERQDAAEAPLQISSQQSQYLWERAFRAELDDSALPVPALARLARTAWRRLQDAGVGIKTVAARAANEDQRLFASVAGRYLATLERKHWIDDAQLGATLRDAITSGEIVLPQRLVLVGFDIDTPVMAEIVAAAEGRGVVVRRQPLSTRRERACSAMFVDGDAELRAAGAWARDYLEQHPAARIAVVKQGLQATAQRDVRLLREGFVPGWQYAAETLQAAVNVSYGQRLATYPAISVALLLLRWLHTDINSRDVAVLLLSTCLGGVDLSERARRELRLRELPDRAWSPAMIVAALGGERDLDWLRRIARIGQWRRRLPRRQAPSAWAVALSQILDDSGWPGSDALDSNAFQLINRWRELLNEFAKLDLVSGTLSLAQAVSRLNSMASDTVYQPESREAALQLLGPLEAAGAEFDAIWVAGLTSSLWPGPGNPSSLVARSLQVDFGLPDATPAATLESASAVFQRLINAAPDVVCSWAATADDAEESPSELLLREAFSTSHDFADPGWNATRIHRYAQLSTKPDNVPVIADGEQTFGGASTLAQQMDEPLQAFVRGRLGVRTIYRQAVGIPPSLRGTVIHDALYRVYRDVSSRETLLAWSDIEISRRAEKAVADALAKHERNADGTLLRLLQIERDRLARLVERFIGLDRQRDDFTVRAVEADLQLQRGPLRLQLRIDRIDALDGESVIFDYKTGATKQLASKKGDVYDPQLFVYALAIDQPVAGVALVNIDGREISWSGAGQGFSDADQWQGMLQSVSTQIEDACKEFVNGDVRMRVGHAPKASRSLNLLSRYAELIDD